jgi:transposase
LPQEATKPHGEARAVSKRAAERTTMKTEKSVSGGESPRQDFDETFKHHAVELTLRRGERTICSIAEELGISEWTLYRWRRLYAPATGGGAATVRSCEDKDREIARLRAEIVRMQERETVLKKSLGILSETPRRGLPRSTA